MHQEKRHLADQGCQPPANHLPTGGDSQQQEIDWDLESLAATARQWGITGIALQLCLLSDNRRAEEAIAQELVEECVTTSVDECTAVRIRSSQRKLARLLGCSGTMIDKALIKLESLGLASRGTDRQGTIIMLWVGRLFDAPATPTINLRPPQKGCQPGANQRPLSLKGKEPFFAVSVSESLGRRARFWNADGLPWQRVTDEDLVAGTRGGDTDILRELYREAVKLGWLDRDQAEPFLAICWHAATAIVSKNYRGRTVENPRIGLLRHRLRAKKFRNLSEESYAFGRQLMQKMTPRPKAVTQMLTGTFKSVE